jgi:maltose/moltooligosaccharide transporter
MENNVASKTSEESAPFKLNYKRTIIIGFAFFGILLLWQVYDSWCPTFLTELFVGTLSGASVEEVQYLVGMIMALDNVAALIMLPIFGHLSDKTKTPIGKRMPYILVGTFVCAIAFPFIPVLFHYHNVAGTIVMMGIVVFFAMMYRNPAVSLMPDITPKPLRSKANGIINIMGYIGGAFATVLGIIFVLSTYLGKDSANWLDNKANIWLIEGPFLIASILMVISCLVLFFALKENKVEEEMKDELIRGEKYAEVTDKVDDDKPLSSANRKMLWLILIAEFFWFMADNGVSTFMGNYTLYYLNCKTSSNMINTIVGGVGSVIGFALGGYFAGKIGRKNTVLSGLGISVFAVILWVLLGYTVQQGSVGADGYNTFPIYIYFVWALKGFGMSLVHINSFPMVVELCNAKKIGKFTGYYYASSMAAQTITPCLVGLFLLIPGLKFDFLPLYALVCLAIACVVFSFIKISKTNIPSQNTPVSEEKK